MMVPAQTNPEDRPAIADVVQRGQLVRDVDWMMDGQHHYRDAESDHSRDGRRVGKHYHRIEAENVVECVLGYPQIAEAQCVSALSNVAQGRDVDGVGRPMRQRDAE